MISKADLMTAVYNRTKELEDKEKLIDDLKDSVANLEIRFQNRVDCSPFRRTIKSLRKDCIVIQQRIDSLTSELT